MGIPWSRIHLRRLAVQPVRKQRFSVRMSTAPETALRALRARQEAEAQVGGPVTWIAKGRPVGSLKAGMEVGEVERAGSPGALPHVLIGFEDEPREGVLAGCHRPGPCRRRSSCLAWKRSPSIAKRERPFNSPDSGRLSTYRMGDAASGIRRGSGWSLHLLPSWEGASKCSPHDDYFAEARDSTRLAQSRILLIQKDPSTIKRDCRFPARQRFH